MQSADSMKVSQVLEAMEREISDIQSMSASGITVQRARDHLVNAIQVVCQIDITNGRVGLSDILEIAAASTTGRREAASLILRTLAVDGLLPFESEPQLERRVVEVVEAGLRDQLRALKIDDKRQTFEKISAFRGLHDSLCQCLRPLTVAGERLPDIVATAPDVMKTVRNGGLSAYLPLFGWTSIKAKINLICDQAIGLHECNDASYKQRFINLEVACEELAELCVGRSSFLTTDYVLPFLTSVRGALSSLRAGAKEKFSCEIEPRRSPPEIAVKRYPLHIKDKWLVVSLPFLNSGPGVAVDVRVEMDTGSQSGLALEEEEFCLGDLPPGEFSISFRAVVVVPMSSVQLALQVTWGELFGEPKSTAINVRLVGQDSTIDWASLEMLEPYGLEVADADRFVGRKSKVQAIGNRLLRSQMSSTYITGQKRIGKTSLAQAVLRYVIEQAKTPLKYRTLYLEWGEYSNADPAKTIETLGECLYSFLCSFLPASVSRPAADFTGSIAPLNNISRLLQQHCPSDRFVFVLDEFDEIHSEMYRFGPLAETFFANLRTLSAKPNFAFILVGGEKMPFIIGAQGDQLNKFSREPLDYFSRSDEWEDYVELVSSPARGQVNWQESALSEIFICTAGHPYYTKLICSRVFTNAVSERDTEIIASDVRRALVQSISELDTNSFAHFWKDGVSEEPREAEVVELKRQRVLVAFGRAARSGTVTRELIRGAIGGLRLDSSSIGPIVDDFLRREVLRESGGILSTSLPLFERWITDIGVTKLIVSTLADDIETALQKTNEAMYVKAGELAELVKQWPLYRGREITAESVRAWLSQISGAQEQRLLFKTLQALKFVTPAQIAELLRTAHNRKVGRVTPPPKRENKVEKRRDLLVTYVDGAGKSGASFARTYAKEIGILLERVVEPSRVYRQLNTDDELPSGIVIVDDFAGTGDTIVTGLTEFLNPMYVRLQESGVPIVVIVLYATEKGEEALQKLVAKFDKIKIDFHIGCLLGEESKAFPTNGVGIWKDVDERDRAKALCVRLGAGLYKDALGYGSQALLISFPDGCPNNSLPLLFASRSGSSPWNALLPR